MTGKLALTMSIKQNNKYTIDQNLQLMYFIDLVLKQH